MLFSGKVKEHFVSALEVPRDLAFQETIVTLTGSNHVLIENYKSIGKLSKEEIIIFCVHGKIIIRGKRLEVTHYTPYEMLVTGRITELCL